MIWLLKVLLFSPQLASSYPDSLLIPTGLFTLLSNEWMLFFFSYQVLMGLKIVLIVALSVFIWKPDNKWLGLITVGTLLIFSNINHSYGNFLNHAEVAVYVIMVFYILSLFLFKPYNDNGLNMKCLVFFSLSAITITVCYSLISIYRFIHGGLELYFGDYMLMTIVERSIQRVDYYLTVGIGVAAINGLKIPINIGFAVTTVFEVLSPLIFYFRDFRYLWLVVMIPFHFSTLFLMNIFFWENMLLMLVLFTGLLKYKK